MSSRKFWIQQWAWLVMLALVSCTLNPNDGSTGDQADAALDDGAMEDASNPAVSRLPRAATLNTLTLEQLSILCDWTNSRQGGYGRVVLCSDGTTKATNTTNAGCVTLTQASGTICATRTVADIEDCTNAIGANLCALTTAAGCAAVRDCL